MIPNSWKKIVRVYSKLVFVILVLAGCASDKEVKTRPLNRYLKEGVYRNSIKGYSLHWPSDLIWNYNDVPEFDLGFNHIDGRSQFFIIGVRKLLRKSFPDGFVEWNMNRLQASDLHFIAHNEITSDPIQKFQIILDSRFMILPRNQFGVDRRVGIYALKKDPYWIALIYISTKEFFEDYLPEIEQIVADIQFVGD